MSFIAFVAILGGAATVALVAAVAWSIIVEPWNRRRLRHRQRHRVQQTRAGRSALPD